MLLRQSRLLILQGRYTEAADRLAQGDPIFQALRVDSQLAESACHAAIIAFHAGDLLTANHRLREALCLRQQSGTARDILKLLDATIQIFIGQNQRESGLLLAGAVSAYRQSQNLVAPPVERQRVDIALAAVRRQLTLDAAKRAWADGAPMTLDQALAYAIATLKA